MTEPLGFNISSLGDVESPEVVRGALRRFRRRVLRAGLIVAILALLTAGIVTAANRDPIGFERLIDSSTDFVEPGAVYRSGEHTLILAKVADLQRGSGLHMVVVYPGIPDSHELRGRLEHQPPVAGSIIEGEGALYDMWVAGPLPASGVFDVVFEVLPRCDDLEPAGGGRLVCSSFQTGPQRQEVRFHLDLNALDVPARLWQGEGGSS